MNGPMFTIGYQGATIERLLETLAGEGVSVLVDTRENPMSRRPEFRRRRLEASLAEAGIGYVAAPELGAPKELRALAADEWDAFADGYRARLPLVREELERLVPLLRTERVCLLCFESDPDACHRSLLAHEIQTLLDVPAIHLRPGRADEADDHERLVVGREVADDQVQVGRR
jgi:uncharacterized protein (DUF488 family)